MEGAEVDRSARRMRAPACPNSPPSMTSIPDVTSPVADLDALDPPLLAPLTGIRMSHVGWQSLWSHGAPIFGPRRRIDFRGARAVARTRGGLS